MVITIRESYWSDNVKVKAADFVYAWCERIINPANPNPAASLFSEIEGVNEAMNGEGSISDIGIKATEMDQITITYKEGADYKRILKNLASVATSPVRQDIVETSESYWSKYSAVTNGAFKIKSYDKSQGTFELTRNVGYHQDPHTKDYDNKVRPGMLYGEFTFPGSDISVSYEDIENKVAFIMSEATLEDRAEYKKKAKTAEHTSTYTYVFNTSHPLFADANVRLALSAVIDRNAIIDAITFGKAADGLIPDVSGGAKDELISSGKNEQKAREYLAAADQSVVNANKAFTLTIDSDEQSEKIAEIVKAAWESLGFTVTVKVAQPVESEVSDGNIFDSGIQYLIKNASYGKFDYDVIAVDWQTYSTDAFAGLAALTSGFNGMGKNEYSGDISLGQPDYSVARKNIAAWSDEAYDALIAAALSCEKKKERAAKLAEAEEYLISKMPVCPLVFNENFVFVGSKISKLKFNGLGNLNLTNVKLSGYTKYYKPEESDEE
ncbi:MAG: hypothetical protein IJW02_06820 [Clostridia bacterium]|nr:hypothetical protein [Clostridia bacterium]